MTIYSLNSWKKSLDYFFEEDGLGQSVYYQSKLPTQEVKARLKLKSSCLLSGLPFFFGVFSRLGVTIEDSLWKEWEGKECQEGSELNFELPFNIALSGERLALNLLQRSSSISTFTRSFVEKAEKVKISVLDTRKTTPGLRFLEKYAVRAGGGKNHRNQQTDLWMIKDNHKTFFGGLKEALQFFKSQGQFYSPIICEIHSLQEFTQAQDLGVKHLMLDNFSPSQIREMVKIKKDCTIEVSGGITQGNFEDYLIEGVDALSLGSLTYAAPPVDLSLKFEV